MPYASINGTEIFYKTVGRGEPCLVMHGGLGFDHTMVHPGLDPLGEMLQLVYYDHRGNGRSGRPPIETLSWEQLARDADGLRSHLGFDRISIVGHSFGAFPAMEYALRYPGQLQRLILVCAVPALDYFPDIVANMRARGASEELVALLDFSKAGNDTVCKNIMGHLAPLYFHQPAERLIHEAIGRILFCADAYRETPRCLAGYSLEPRLKEIRVPTLLLAGADDFFMPLAQMRRLQKGIPTATMAVFDQSGHLPYLEEPGKFFHVVREWVKANP
ncbi:MAG: alpha/beta hydrolase [Nitrospira sp.]